MTTALSPAEAVELLRRRTDDGVRLLLGLSDQQLGLETRPPRSKSPALAETIQGMLIDHIDSHREEIQAKLQRAGGRL